MYHTKPSDLGWGKVTSLFCPVSVAVPFCSNLELLFLACDGKFSYTLIHRLGHNLSSRNCNEKFTLLIVASYLIENISSLLELPLYLFPSTKNEKQTEGGWGQNRQLSFE